MSQLSHTLGGKRAAGLHAMFVLSAAVDPLYGRPVSYARRKAARDAKEHGVTFEAARLAFEDPRAIDRLDLDEPDEDRMLLTRLANNVLLTVCFAERGHK